MPTEQELLQMALRWIEKAPARKPGDVYDKAALIDAIREKTRPRREWAGLDRKEMLSIIDQQQAYKETGLPMFYRDQCLDMLRAIEAKLKEKNA